MAQDLTKKEEKFVAEYIENGGNGTKAALAAYDTDSENTAAVIAHENIRKPKIRDLLAEALPDHLLAEVHREGLYATRTVFDKKGEPVGEDADFIARAKYLDMAYKILGKYAPTKAVHAHIDMTKQPLSPRIIELAKKLNS